jgi:hypothetical protein
MRETWLRPNRRAIWFGCVLPLVVCALGAWITIGIAAPSHNPLGWLGIVMMGGGFTMAAALLRQMVRPRIAYQDGKVLFYLRSGRPFAVPVEIVEAFFVGQGPATFPGRLARHQRTFNLVARLSQRAAEWAHRDVKPALGKWCDSYVTISGAWCEPLTDELPRRLNRRLKEVKSCREAITT